MSLLHFEDAVATVLREVRTLAAPGRELVTLAEAAGRTLAQTVRADRDQPPFDRSTRDGFAVRAQDEGARTLIGMLRAGELWKGPALEAGHALRIMTGAPLPAGADAVLMVEHAAVTGASLTPGRALRPGENIVRAAAEARAGDVLLEPGALLGPAEIALAAACGASPLQVFRRPEVAIVATGDELVELDQEPAPHQIRNSNGYTLAALAAAEGALTRRLPIARDTLGDLRARLAEGRTSDLLLLSGGVSMGEYDLVEQVLEEAGAEFFFTGVRMQPGKPVVFGRLPAYDSLPACHFFGLPGNPISTQVTFLCFAAPLLRVLAGQPPAGPRYRLAILAVELEARAGLTRLLPARHTGEAFTVAPLTWQGSGDQTANARADCYVELLPDRFYRRGEHVRVLAR